MRVSKIYECQPNELVVTGTKLEKGGEGQGDEVMGRR